MLTPYQIAARADHLFGRDNIAEINRLFRAQDTSNLWPITGRFNVTERAIRRVQRQRASTLIGQGLEYALSVNDEISAIVNAEQ
jgi:hypothetical protein